MNGTRVGPMELLNFFGSSAACLKVRGGYVELGSSIHHARIYRIDGKKTSYAMVRVFQVDLLRLKDQDLFTTPLKPSTISMRTAEPKIRQALADGTATQIGWLVEGDELQIDTSKYSGGFIGEVLERYPEATSWRVAGFMTPAKLRIKPPPVVEGRTLSTRNKQSDWGLKLLPRLFKRLLTLQDGSLL